VAHICCAPDLFFRKIHFWCGFRRTRLAPPNGTRHVAGRPLTPPCGPPSSARMGGITRHRQLRWDILGRYSREIFRENIPRGYSRGIFRGHLPQRPTRSHQTSLGRLHPPPAPRPLPFTRHPTARPPGLCSRTYPSPTVTPTRPPYTRPPARAPGPTRHPPSPRQDRPTPDHPPVLPDLPVTPTTPTDRWLSARRPTRRP